jgi:hypothetical protein
MQPTIHLERKAVYGSGKHPALPSDCIVGCIFNSIGFIIILESLCISRCATHVLKLVLEP